MSAAKRKILAISGSTRKNSSNFKILSYISNQLNSKFEVEIFEDIDQLPHFNPDLDNQNPPIEIHSFRNKIINFNMSKTNTDYIYNLYINLFFHYV